MALPSLILEFEPLLKAARPTVYQTNAFRMIGVAVDTPVAEISRQVQKVEMMLKLHLSNQAPVGLLPLPSQPSLATLQEARQRLSDPQARLIEELFWFWPEEPGGSKSDLAFQALQRRDLQSAKDIWLNRSRKPTDTSSIHNLAILHHLQALDAVLATSDQGSVAEGLWIQAWKYWRTVVDHDPFWTRLASRICELEDPRLTSAAKGQIRSSLLSAMLQIDLALAVRAAEAGDYARAGVHGRVTRESGLPAEVIREQTEHSLEHVRNLITHRCASAEAETSVNVDQTAQILKRLLHDARPKLDLLNYLLGAGNRLRDAAHDQVAKTVRDSLIDFGNKTEDWKACEELLTAIQPLAASQSYRTQIAEDLAVVRRLRESSMCWFCEENRPDEKTAAVVEMYGEVTRTATSEGTHVEWRFGPVKVPRCRQCRRMHVGRGVSIASAAGLVAAIVAWNANEPFVPAVLATLAAWLGTIAARYSDWFGKIRAQDGTKLVVRREMAKRHHPTIADLKSQGWAFGKRPDSDSIDITGAAVGKLAAWAGVVVILTLLFSALAGPRGATSTTAPGPTPPAPPQPPQFRLPRAQRER